MLSFNAMAGIVGALIYAWAFIVRDWPSIMLALVFTAITVIVNVIGEKTNKK